MSGVSRAAINNVCSGKSCSDEAGQKIAKALGDTFKPIFEDVFGAIGEIINFRFKEYLILFSLRTEGRRAIIYAKHFFHIWYGPKCCTCPGLSVILFSRKFMLLLSPTTFRKQEFSGMVHFMGFLRVKNSLQAVTWPAAWGNKGGMS